MYLLDTIRIPTNSTPTQTLAAQLRAICPHLPSHPVLITDRAYPTSSFFRETADIRCDHLSRLPINRVFYHAAPSLMLTADDFARRSKLPMTIAPERWLKVIDGRYYVRKVKSNAGIEIDSHHYSVPSDYQENFFFIK